MTDLHAAARECLIESDPTRKCVLTARTRAQLEAGELRTDDSSNSPPLMEPGRPERPRLVAPRQLAQRSVHTAQGLAALVHALAHIEFNAINLAWDAVHRFRGLPPEYYEDWVRVAAEEAVHFGLLRDWLRAAGRDYGDFDAHDGLWEMARKTASDPLLRMALVPRVLEARGLDVTPGMIERLRQVGAEQVVQILELIYREEVGHVAVGSRWFNYLCERRGVEPRTTFRRLLSEHSGPAIRGPFNAAARAQAGFTSGEMQDLYDLQRGCES